MAIDFGTNPQAPPPNTQQKERIKDVLAIDSGDIVDATDLGGLILTASDASTIVDALSVSSENHTHPLSSLEASGAINGQVIKFIGNQWVPSTDINSGVWGFITGDLTTQPDLSAQFVSARNRDNHTGTQHLSTLKGSGASPNQVPTWSGSAWTPSNGLVSNTTSYTTASAINNIIYITSTEYNNLPPESIDPLTLYVLV